MQKKVSFFSRGYDSGTNAKELDIWDDGVTPKGQERNLKAGAMMGDTLLFANQKKAYVLSDGGMFLNYESSIRLKIMVESDPLLKSQYSVIAVSLAKYPSVWYSEAMDFIAFVTSLEGQKIIATYVKHGVNRRNSRVGGNEEKTIVCS